MKKKKEKEELKRFLNLSTGQPVPYFTPSPNCPTEPVRCHRNHPSKKRLQACPVEAAGQCPEASALSAQLNQLRTDTESVKAILKSADTQEQCKRLLLTGSDKDIPDESFFYALKIHGYKILSFPFAQQKMERWEGEKKSTDKNIRDKAKDNFIKIGTSLAETGHNRGSDFPGYIAIIWEVYCGEIEERGIDKLKTEGNLKVALRELLQDAPEDLRPSPETIKKILNDKYLKVGKYIYGGADEDDKKISTKKITSESLADLIVARKFNLTPLTVRQYRKETKIAASVYRAQ